MTFRRHLLLDKPALIKERHNGPVGDGFVDGIFMDQPAKCGERIFFFLQQRRSGKAEVAGLRQHPPHLLGELAVAAVAPGLGAMALIDQNKNVGVGVAAALAPTRRRSNLLMMVVISGFLFSISSTDGRRWSRASAPSRRI